MVDLILFAVVLGAFAGGFYCGKTFGSPGVMFARVKAVVAEWFR